MVKVKEEKPDLVYLDIMLPGIDGYEFCVKLKQLQNDAVKVIMLTNLGQMEEMEKARSLGAADFLIKANIDLKNLVELTKTKFLAVG